ncbi:hypothetical protein CHH65_02665 [Shouchella clausii]|nr:hypothetical protein CHH73_07655 [Shouchella clausii]PAD48645.1 hypothetical protein CHI09_01370 [Shouchella clausii]PAF11071.1 hypothetical protein CHH65_02665 [Shouchella clausii]
MSPISFLAVRHQRAGSHFARRNESMKQLLASCIAICAVLFLSACFLPQEQRAENQIAYPDQLAAVQTAVDQFHEDTGVLPITNFDENTHEYQRYTVDFRQLVPRYMQQPPGTAFENGGTHQYTLINVEEDPEVKVLDVTAMNVVRDLQQRIYDYMREHTYAPIGEALDYNLFTLDYKALGYSEEPYVASPYNQTSLPLLFTNEGEVVIDYLLDLKMAEQEKDFEEGVDLRRYLYEDSPFLPLYSVPYSLDEEGNIQYDTRFYD